MDFYGNRRITLDPGLTALALRGLHRRDGYYPFLERHTRWRGFRVDGPAVRSLLAAWFPTVRALFEARSTLG
jgi:hypothetical protein